MGTTNFDVVDFSGLGPRAQQLVGGGGGTISPLLDATVSTGTAAANQFLLQSALQSGNYVQLRVPGIYLYTGNLRMPSRTTLELGAGVTLKLADQSNVTGIRNALYDAATTAVTATSFTTVVDNPGAASGEMYMTVTSANHGLTTATRFASVAGATNFGWNGTFRIRSVPDANTITLWLYRAPLDAAAAGSTITLAPADYDISIIGQGVLDHNGTNQTALNDNRFGLVLRHVYRPTVRGIRIVRGNKYAFDGSDVASATVHDVDLDTDSDGIHFQGPVWGANIRNITGRSGDDFVAFTGGDYDHDPASRYTLSKGDFDGIVIDGLYPTNCYYAIKATGNDQHRYHTFSAKNVAGVAKHGAVFMQADWDQNSMILDAITFENISTASLDPANWPMLFFDVGSAQRITMRNIYPQHTTQPVIRIQNSYGAGSDPNKVNSASSTTIGTIDVENVHQASAHANAILLIGNGQINIGTINFGGDVTLAAAGLGIKPIGSGTIGRINFVRGSFTGDPGGQPLRIEGTVQVNEVCYSPECRLVGVHSFFHEAVTTVDPTNAVLIRFAGYLETMNNFAVLRTAQAHRIFFADAILEGTHSNTIQKLATNTGATVVEGSIHAGRSGVLPGNIVSNKASGSGNLTVNGPTFQQAVDTVTRVDGAMLYNSKTAANNGTDGAVGAGLLVGVGAASGSYKRLGTTGGSGNQY